MQRAATVLFAMPQTGLIVRLPYCGTRVQQWASSRESLYSSFGGSSLLPSVHDEVLPNVAIESRQCVGAMCCHVASGKSHRPFLKYTTFVANTF